jgi:Flp pilus assembly protein TadD
VKLNPQTASVHLDRGYLRLMRGDKGGADADFKQVLVLEQANAQAIFGRSLIKAMNGAMGPSRTERGRAFDLDPKVAEKVEATYGLQIWPEFRSR